MSDLVTIEFYGDPLGVKLIGAVDVPKKRMMESAEALGKAICRVNKMNLVECVMIGEDGEKMDSATVYR